MIELQHLTKRYGDLLVQVGTPRELMANPADDSVRWLMSTPRRQAELVDELLATPPGEPEA